MGKINLSTLLGFLPVVGPAIAALPQFKTLFDEIVSTLHPDDQQTAKDAYAAAMAQATAAHEGLQNAKGPHG